MKKLLLLFILVSVFVSAQQQDEVTLRQLANKYTTLLNAEGKEEELFKMFYGPVQVNGVFTARSFAKRTDRVAEASQIHTEDYKTFITGFKKYRSQNKTDNVQVITDGEIASVTSDYSCFYKDVMEHWGKEILTFVKINNDWKISSVTFSMELAHHFKQPSLQERTKK
ncbi:nuclear transport factor 2 family protein [Chryseobacterium sp. JK1]|uniref:nuclear transport factor 2 family protein n=1 Tax=Chryseobacterium sp. JK1 TaxID=874294 RepID=UPI003D68A34F